MADHPLMNGCNLVAIDLMHYTSSVLLHHDDGEKPKRLVAG